MTRFSMRVLLAVFLTLILPAPASGAPVEGKPDFASPGPYPVGVRTVLLVDGERKDEFAGGPRTLLTEVWYPAGEEARGRPRMRFPEFFGPYSQEGSKALRRDLTVIDKDFRTLAVRDAPLRPGRWPLLIFSHGNGGFRHQNVFQMDHLASHGYVVASPDHTGNAKLTPLPGRPIGYDRGGRGRSAEDRPRDARFLIDRLLACDRPELDWMRGAADPEAVGVLGHSFGGFTAVRVVGEDPRIKAILPMTVAFVGKPTTTPTMVMLGSQDRTVGMAGNLASRGYFLGCSGPRYLFVLKRGGHFTFTEMGLIHPNFGDGIGRGKGAEGEEMEFIPGPLAKEIINSYTLAFFEHHLRRSAAAGSFLERNAYPGELEWWSGDRKIPHPGGDPGRQGTVENAPPLKAARF